MQQTHMGSATSRPARRNMTNRSRQDLFLAFDRWGWDEKGWASTTRYRYVRRAKVADEWLMEHENIHLTWAKPEQVKTYLFSTPGDAGNRNDVRSGLVAFGNFCVAQGWRPDNPAQGLPRLPVPKPLPKALDVEQARRCVVMADSFEPMYRALILVFLYTGVRRAEAMTLEWRNVTPEWITVMGKGSKERDVSLHQVASDALYAWKLSCRDARWCFPSPHANGRPLSRETIRDTVSELGDMCGIAGLHPHMFRHTMATRMVEMGYDITKVQVALGHARLGTTEVYTRVRPGAVKEAMDALDFAGPVVLPEPEEDTGT